MRTAKALKRASVFLQVLVLASLSFLVVAPVGAQVAGARLSGTVMDPTGGVVPKAEISITNVATQVTTRTIANSDGFYSAPNLLPGSYEIKVAAPGFKTEVRSGVNLTVGLEQVLDVNLQVGQTSQQVEVTTSVPGVELASSTIGSLVNSKTIVDLPLNGRDWTLLATLQPAVNSVLTQASTAGSLGPRGNRGFGNALSISGTRPVTNNYRLDGISIVDGMGGAPGSVASVALGVDAIAEFSVLTSNYSAEYGRTSGGVINAVTRSGTNQFHGTAYWFLRDEGFDAKSFFDQERLPFHRNQFGGSIGGPIQKDKTFFFADFEGFRQGLEITNVDRVPSQDARNGILHNADGTTTTVTVNPLVAPFLPLYPLPNAGLIGVGNTGIYDIATNDNTWDNFATVRIDRRLSSKDNFFGSWFYDSALDARPDSLDNVITANKSFRTMISLEETHVFSPSLVNSVRFGYSRVATTSNRPIQTINPLSADLSLSAVPGRPAPTLNVSGVTTYNGPGGISSPDHYWNSFQFYDDGFLTRGVHSFKFGFAFERMQHNLLIAQPLNGVFNFGSLQNFLTNQPTSFSGVAPGTVTPRGLRQSLLGGYFQDDWRLRSNLTLNLGLRYEMTTVINEVQNKLVNLIPLSAPTATLGAPLYRNPTLHNFEPRVGFSWDPLRDGKTAVRGAFGIFDVLPLSYEFYVTEANAAPFEETLGAGNLPAGSFPTQAYQLASLPTAAGGAYVQFNPKRNYLMIWNLNVQRQLTPSTMMTVGYVGNHGVHMINRDDDMNMVLPTLTSGGYLWPSPIGSGIKVNPNFGDIHGQYWGGNDTYNALEAQVTKKMSHGFQVQGSYTFAKGLDTGSASTIGDPFTNSITSLLWFCARCRRGLSDTNIAHTLIVNYIWALPNPKNMGAIGSHVLGGWQFVGIVTAQTGLPFTPLIGGDPLGTNSSDPFAYPNRLSGPGCHSAVNSGNVNNYINLNCFGVPMAPASLAAQCVPFSAVPGSCANLLGNSGRNSVVGPGLVDFDLSFFKNNYITKISETFNAQFRVEFFNIFNRANFAVPVDNSTLFDQSGNPVPGAGAIDQVATPPREIQFALKLIW
jgi:hypothetical protein